MGQCSSANMPYQPQHRSLSSIRQRITDGQMKEEEFELKLGEAARETTKSSSYNTYTTTNDDIFSEIPNDTSHRQRDSTLTITLFDGSTLGRDDVMHHVGSKNKSLNALLRIDEQGSSSSGTNRRSESRRVPYGHIVDDGESGDVIHELGNRKEHILHLPAPNITSKSIAQSRRSSRLPSNMSSQFNNTSITSSIHMSPAHNTQNSYASHIDTLKSEQDTNSEFESIDDEPAKKSGIAIGDGFLRGIPDNDSFNSPRSVQQNSMIFRPQGSGIGQGASCERNNTDDTNSSSSSSKIEAVQSFHSIQKITAITSTEVKTNTTLPRSKNPMPEFKFFSKPFYARVEWVQNRPATNLSDQEDSEPQKIRQQQLYIL